MFMGLIPDKILFCQSAVRGAVSRLSRVGSGNCLHINGFTLAMRKSGG